MTYPGSNSCEQKQYQPPAIRTRGSFAGAYGPKPSELDVPAAIDGAILQQSKQTSPQSSLDGRVLVRTLWEMPCTSPGRHMHDSATEELTGVVGAVVTGAVGEAGGKRWRSATGGGGHVHGVAVGEDIGISAAQLFQVTHHLSHGGTRFGHVTAAAQGQCHERLQRLRWVVRDVRVDHGQALPRQRPLMGLQPANQLISGLNTWRQLFHPLCRLYFALCSIRRIYMNGL